MSQLDTVSSLPASSTAPSGSPPVATITRSRSTPFTASPPAHPFRRTPPPPPPPPGPPLAAGGQAELAAGIGRGFEQDDGVAALAGDPRRLQPARPGADDHDLLRRSVRAADDMRHRRLAPGRGVVHAERLIALIDA